jgi:hypothetical protein
MTDCSSLKEESLPIRNRNHAGAPANHSETGIKTGRTNPISRREFHHSTLLSNFAAQDCFERWRRGQTLCAKFAKKGRNVCQASPHSSTCTDKLLAARSVVEMAFERL